VIPVGAVLVDFDGTATLRDVAESLLMAFGDPSWPAYDEKVDRREIGLRDAIQIQNRMLRATRDELVEHALRYGTLDPTFGPFVDRLRDDDVPIALVSDGFGFYIEPILDAAGLSDLPVIANEQTWNDEGRPAGLRFVNGHPECVGCGTCKMQAVRRYQHDHGTVAFVGDGQTDRYAALYADVTFAKRELVGYCRVDGVPYLPWENFDDVTSSLEGLAALPGPVAPLRCPGWTVP
jgi:2-hydroxy-3-keto-5-methylthiopentenyl-1-phosphate phosphatase